jgi:hypothetical protein
MPPIGFQRSRALWDNCSDSTNYHNRYYDENNNNNINNNNNNNNNMFSTWVKISRYLRAILYEIQPIRYSVFVSNLGDSYRYFSIVGRNIIIWGRSWIPRITSHAIKGVRSLTWEQWKWTILIAVYYVFVRWIHDTLNAGPVVLIVTALTCIFTVGLSDQTNNDGLSAYSVFNKGFQKIMGSIDADDLLQQHLGGGGVMQMMQRRPVGDGLDLDEEPQHRRPQPQVHNNLRNNNNQNPAAENNVNQNRARRTGKKARRDQAAVEHRREIRAQRDAALAMGIGHINDDDLVARFMDDNNGALLHDEN